MYNMSVNIKAMKKIPSNSLILPFTVSSALANLRIAIDDAIKDGALTEVRKEFAEVAYSFFKEFLHSIVKDRMSIFEELAFAVRSEPLFVTKDVEDRFKGDLILAVNSVIMTQKPQRYEGLAELSGLDFANGLTSYVISELADSVKNMALTSYVEVDEE